MAADGTPGKKTRGRKQGGPQINAGRTRIRTEKRK
jgi:hypothetical protein